MTHEELNERYEDQSAIVNRVRFDLAKVSMRLNGAVRNSPRVYDAARDEITSQIEFLKRRYHLLSSSLEYETKILSDLEEQLECFMPEHSIYKYVDIFILFIIIAGLALVAGQ